MHEQGFSGAGSIILDAGLVTAQGSLVVKGVPFSRYGSNL
jgi:hypothetical protein